MISHILSCDCSYLIFFFNDTATTEIYTLSLHDALPIFFLYPDATNYAQGKLRLLYEAAPLAFVVEQAGGRATDGCRPMRSEEHTSELQSRLHLVCRLLLEKKKTKPESHYTHHNIATAVP